MRLFKLLSSLPRPILHHTCQRCNGCGWSSDHIVSESTIRSLYPTSSSTIRKDPHNVFIICTSLNKRKANYDVLTSALFPVLTDEGKGVVARAYLYMEYKYGIKTLHYDIMKVWHLSHPPQFLEITRHEALKGKYGINPFIEKFPNLIES